MAAPAGKAPILESASAGLRFAVHEWRSIAPIAGAGGVALSALSLAMLDAQARQNIGAALGLTLATLLVTGVVYALLFRRALAYFGEQPSGPVSVSIGAVYGSMAIVGFFLFIVFVVLMIPAVAVIGSALEPFLEDIQAAQGDQAAMAAIMQRAVVANPGPFALIVGLGSFIWLALTSRLYLAAPASVAQGKALSFETWRWTAGNMLRIIAARLMVLAPLWIAILVVVGLLTTILGGAAQSVIGHFAVQTIAQALSIGALYAAEAGLGVYLYRGLRPA